MAFHPGLYLQVVTGLQRSRRGDRPPAAHTIAVLGMRLMWGICVIRRLIVYELERAALLLKVQALGFGFLVFSTLPLMLGLVG